MGLFVLRRWVALVIALALVGACSEDPDSAAGSDGTGSTSDAGQRSQGSEVGAASEVAADDGSAAETCLPDELCVTVMAVETTGADLRLMLYEVDASDWPHRYRGLPTPSWVVSE